MFDRGIHPKPQKMKELTEIGGGYAHVRVGGFVVAESEKAKASSGTNGIKFFSCICNLSLSNFIASIIGLFVVVDTKFCTCCITCSAFTGCKKGKRARF